MAKSNAWETKLLLLLFNNTDAAGIGDASGLQGSGAAGSLYVSLHTADPGEGGSQNTSECSYTGYARVAVSRSAGGWTVSGNQVQNTGVVTFPQATGGSETASHIGIGEDPTGAGDLLYSESLTASLPISSGITPEFAANAITLTEE